MNIPFPPVDFPEPVIHGAQRNFHIMVEGENDPIKGFLRKDDAENHEYAYAKTPKLPIILPNGRGRVYYAEVYTRRFDMEGYYNATGDSVVVKKLCRARIEGGGNENPFREISVGQMIGNDVNVVSMKEALQDDRYLYMVMPFFGQDLLDGLFGNEGNPNVPLLLTTLVNNLLYLEENHVIHRDLSPENIIVNASMGERECPMIDFAMALQCAVLEGNEMPTSPQDPPCGKLPYISPEVVYLEPLSHGVDVWATGVILFVIWTRQRLYATPHDRAWDYFLRYGGLEQDRPDIFDVDAMMNAENPVPEEFMDMCNKINAVRELSPMQRQLLADMLRLRPEERIRSNQILQHPWLQEPQQQQQILLQ